MEAKEADIEQMHVNFDICLYLKFLFMAYCESGLLNLFFHFLEKDFENPTLQYIRILSKFHFKANDTRLASWDKLVVHVLFAITFISLYLFVSVQQPNFTCYVYPLYVCSFQCRFITILIYPPIWPCGSVGRATVICSGGRGLEPRWGQRFFFSFFL